MRRREKDRESFPETSFKFLGDECSVNILEWEFVCRYSIWLSSVIKNITNFIVINICEGVWVVEADDWSGFKYSYSVKRGNTFNLYIYIYISRRNWDETKLFSQTEMHAYILQFHSTRPLLHLTIILWPTYAASIVSKTCLTIFIHAADLYFFLS